MMRDFANWALETAKVRGATYADARVMNIRSESMTAQNGDIEGLVQTEHARLS